MLYFAKEVDGEITFNRPLAEILETVKHGGAIKVLNPAEVHTERQRKWYRGICLKGLAEWNGDSEAVWDSRLKEYCGGDELLKKDAYYRKNFGIIHRMTIKGVSKKNMTTFIENILEYAITTGLPVTPPDPDLRRA